MADAVNLSTFRSKFEAGRSFDLEDDLEFCPSLLTENDVSLTFPLGGRARRVQWSRRATTASDRRMRLVASAFRAVPVDVCLS